MAESLIEWVPIQDWVFVDIYDDGETKIKVGDKAIWLPSDVDFGPDALTAKDTENKHRGIRGRWAMVIGVNDRGEEVGLKVGQKVFLDELKWTRGFFYDETRLKAWAIHLEDILVIDEDGFDDDEAAHIMEKYFEGDSDAGMET